jgi:hypothetical protein
LILPGVLVEGAPSSLTKVQSQLQLVSSQITGSEEQAQSCCKSIVSKDQGRPCHHKDLQASALQAPACEEGTDTSPTQVSQQSLSRPFDSASLPVLKNLARKLRNSVAMLIMPHSFLRLHLGGCPVLSFHPPFYPKSRISDHRKAWRQESCHQRLRTHSHLLLRSQELCSQDPACHRRTPNGCRRMSSVHRTSSCDLHSSCPGSGLRASRER